ncbi:hypothetical protein EV126DRAFT_416309 [Verticillium dahliae]|nr:hypothetical protein EV126DRAFT_416309 [Verticillium dahliae]
MPASCLSQYLLPLAYATAPISISTSTSKKQDHGQDQDQEPSQRPVHCSTAHPHDSLHAQMPTLPPILVNQTPSTGLLPVFGQTPFFAPIEATSALLCTCLNAPSPWSSRRQCVLPIFGYGCAMGKRLRPT